MEGWDLGSRAGIAIEADKLPNAALQKAGDELSLHTG
jgi:hypothetical protein